ncbi:hypothetical protein CEUSTIGMA_g7835.t1 [Chlamydomonas eustigma]|uniref:Uncharacterized protein n=1 Tax=Chlamydomonas eustigma TaxID=1157962 RepID=A0A250XBG5_9CHLO|nr:hypothetical protein CEUSTIGMA_g7835.t1 [Chlamydomonas eustigma]|eukprot:GAX80396.1 hypothetical protein CEUSTIGMA_g7835.t1 [Chlamydomonas eustigma]
MQLLRLYTKRMYAPTSKVKLLSMTSESPLYHTKLAFSVRMCSNDSQGSFFSGGGKGSGPTDSYRNSLDEEPEDSSNQSKINAQYPAWMKVWLLVTALFYLYARMKWRRDLQEKQRELLRVQDMEEREGQQWSAFQKEYQRVGAQHFR